VLGKVFVPFNYFGFKYNESLLSTSLPEKNLRNGAQWTGLNLRNPNLCWKRFFFFFFTMNKNVVGGYKFKCNT
jgi:hypothetical protein